MFSGFWFLVELSFLFPHGVETHRAHDVNITSPQRRCKVIFMCLPGRLVSVLIHWCIGSPVQTGYLLAPRAMPGLGRGLDACRTG